MTTTTSTKGDFRDIEHRILIAEARELARAHWPEHEAAPGGSCLILSTAMTVVARRAGICLILQAGSLQWRCVPEELDDGVSPTHFATMWDPEHPLSLRARAEGRLPEMHVWLGDPARQEIVDLATGDLPRVSRALGIPWTAPAPPPHLWCPVAEVPEAAYYQVNPAATHLATRLSLRLMCELLGVAVA